MYAILRCSISATHPRDGISDTFHPAIGKLISVSGVEEISGPADNRAAYSGCDTLPQS